MKKLSLLLIFSFSLKLQALDLKDLLRNSLVSDPSLAEAKANLMIAENQVSLSEAGHYPIITLNTSQKLSQRYRDDNNHNFGIGVNAKLNLYSWGAIESEIARDKAKYGYFENKYFETQEQLGKSIAELYLNALRAKENIEIYHESLARHDKILKDIEVIAKHDRGRRFEVSEAISRRNQVATTLLQQQRILEINLSRLSRYNKKVISPEELIDPFPNLNTKKFIRYFSNKELLMNPSYKAQLKEFESAQAAYEASQARRKPAINLEGNASRDDYQIFVGLSWDLYNPSSKHQEAQSYYLQEAARAKLNEITLELEESSQTAEIEMERNQKLIDISHTQIGLQKQVVADYELQFKIARRTLMNLLDSYQDLTNSQIAEIAAKNDYREAALKYLVSQAKITSWAGLSFDIKRY